MEILLSCLIDNPVYACSRSGGYRSYFPDRLRWTRKPGKTDAFTPVYEYEYGILEPAEIKECLLPSS